MEMRSIADFNKMGIGETIRLYLGEAWYFEKWYEKVILILMSVFGMWKICGWIF